MYECPKCGNESIDDFEIQPYGKEKYRITCHKCHWSVPLKVIE